jgi:hydrogenase maturation protease
VTRVLVIGYGNELRGDDGAGYQVAEELTAGALGSGVDVIARRQLTPELALDVSRAQRLILVDAAIGVAAGQVEVHRLAPEPGPGQPWSHHMTPHALLALARELYDAAPDTWVVSVGAAATEFGQGLSPEVRAALPLVAQRVKELARA